MLDELEAPPKKGKRKYEVSHRSSAIGAEVDSNIEACSRVV